MEVRGKQRERQKRVLFWSAEKFRKRGFVRYVAHCVVAGFAFLDFVGPPLLGPWLIFCLLLRFHSFKFGSIPPQRTLGPVWFTIRV